MDGRAVQVRCTAQSRAIVRGLGTVGQWIDATGLGSPMAYRICTVVETTHNEVEVGGWKVTPSPDTDMNQVPATSSIIESHISFYTLF